MHRQRDRWARLEPLCYPSELPAPASQRRLETLRIEIERFLDKSEPVAIAAPVAKVAQKGAVMVVGMVAMKAVVTDAATAADVVVAANVVIARPQARASVRMLKAAPRK